MVYLGAWWHWFLKKTWSRKFRVRLPLIWVQIIAWQCWCRWRCPLWWPSPDCCQKCSDLLLGLTFSAPRKDDIFSLISSLFKQTSADSACSCINKKCKMSISLANYLQNYRPLLYFFARDTGYRAWNLDQLKNQSRNLWGMKYEFRARICTRLWSPEIDSEESISPAHVAWRASTPNRVFVPARQAGNRYLGSLKGLQIRA